MSDETDMTLRLERLIPMHPDRLFALWTEPAQLAKWWAPEGYEPAVHVLDSRPGGFGALRCAAPTAMRLRPVVSIASSSHRAV
jgi:uncharacterized protein YndB with AHSA1/START domain